MSQSCEPCAALPNGTLGTRFAAAGWCWGSVSSNLGVLLLALEAHEGTGAHGMA